MPIYNGLTDNSGELGLWMVGGTIRNTGSGFAWIDDANHTPLNVTPTITTALTYVRINFAYTAEQVVTFIVAPDDSFAGRYAVAPVVAGASVGLASADLYFSDADGNDLAPSALTTTLFSNSNWWIFGILRGGVA